jgi:hypothetical protein
MVVSYILRMNAPSKSSALTKAQISKRPTNKRLSLWLSKLPKHTLALNEEVSRKVLNMIRDPDSTAEQLALVIQQDPVLSLKLYLKGYRQLRQRDGNIQGLVHLIGLLGLNQIKEIITQNQKQQTTCDGQRELFAASYFAGHLASRLLPIKHGTRGERFFLPSLLFNAPLWLMWSAAPKIMEYGQTMASRKNMPLEPVCQKSLGFSVHDLLEQTQVFLPLPDSTLKALEIDFHHDMKFWAKAATASPQSVSTWFDEDNQARLKFFSVESGLLLINHFVLAVYLDWNGKHIRRYSRLLARHAGISEEELGEIVSSAATHLQLPNYMKGAFAPLYRYRGLHRELPDTQSTNTATILKQYLQQLRDTHNVRRCLQLSLEALTEGVQAKHCLILTIEQSRIKAPFSYGFEGQNAENLDLDFNDCGQLFKSLLQKPMALSIDSSKLDRIGKQLPKALTHFWQPEPCGVMSLFQNGTPYAIVICDHPQWTEKRQKQFKIIGKELNQSLKQCDLQAI